VGGGTQARTGRGIHGLPKVLPGPAKPDPYTPCRWATPKTALQQGGQPAAIFFPLGYSFPYGPVLMPYGQPSPVGRDGFSTPPNSSEKDLGKKVLGLLLILTSNNNMSKKKTLKQKIVLTVCEL
jgi:hypothetical protein